MNNEYGDENQKEYGNENEVENEDENEDYNIEKDVKKIIDSRLSSMNVSNDLEGKIISGAKNKLTLRKRPLMIAAIICIMVLISVPVMASSSAFQNFLLLVSPKTAEKLQPIQLVSESNGIKLEIIAALNDGRSAVVYYTLNDMTDQGRIGVKNDELMGDLHLTVGSGSQGSLIGYDENTKTATYKMNAFSSDILSDKSLGIQMSSLFADRINIGIREKSYDTGIKIMDIISKTPEVFEPKNSGRVSILKNDVMNIKIPGVDFLTISNAGFVDGKLHIQFKAKNSRDINPCTVFFKLKDGRQAETEMMNFNVDETGRVKIGGTSYYEFVSDVNEDDLISSTIQGRFSNYKSTVGDWKTSFKLKKVDVIEKTATNVDLGEFIAEKVTITPLGILIEGSGEIDRHDYPAVIIRTKDGSRIKEIEGNGGKVFGGLFLDSGRYFFYYHFNDWFDIESMKEFRLNGKLIDLK